MPAIEITTTQNVVIQYEVATLFDRIVAFVVDFIAICLIYFMIYLGFLGFINYQSDALSLIPAIFLAFYSLIWERFSGGQTIGKKVVGLRVIKVDGGQPDGVDYFKRWSLRLLDIYLSLGSLAMITISSTELGQRLGDTVADTLVIKVKKSRTFSVNDFVKLANADDYVPKYPQAQMLSESYVLDLKRLVSRFSKSGESSQLKNLIIETTSVIESELNISSNGLKPIDFIHQIIRDYVILTR